MSEIGEIFAALKEEGRIKKQNNLKNSIDILKEQGVLFKRLSETHYRIGDFDFWPSTGKFLNRKTNKYSRGVFNLLKQLKPRNTSEGL